MSQEKNVNSGVSLGLLTFGWAMLLIAASFFARQALTFFQDLAGRESISLIVWAVFIVFLMGLIRFGIANPGRMPAVIAVFSAGVAYAFTFDITEERIHLVKYGVLGWLVSRDLSASRGTFSLAAAILIGSAVALADETVQHFLPYRVGDPRDVCFGALGSLWGGALFVASRSK